MFIGEGHLNVVISHRLSSLISWGNVSPYAGKKRENGSVTFPLFFSFSRQDEKSSACCEADTPVMEIYFSYSQSLCFGDCRSICSGLNTL